MTCTPEAGRGLTRIPAIAFAVALLLLGPGAPGGATRLPQAAELVAKGREAIAAGDGIAAEAHLKQALEKGAARESVAAYMGQALMLQGELHRARDWLTPGRFTRATEALGFRTLAKLEWLQGDLPAAGGAFDRVLALTPRDATMWAEIARLRYAGGEHDLALDAANYAFDLDPANVRVLELRAQLVRDQQGLPAALPWFKAALARAPGDTAVLAEYAATLGDLGRAKEMLAVTRKLLEIDPGNDRAYFLQAVLAARAGNSDLARRLMGRVHDDLQDLPARQLLEGVLELRAGNPVLAAEAFEALLRRQPDNERVKLLLVRALYLSGEHRALLIRFGGDADDPRASPYLLTLLARSHEALGQRDRAAPLLDRAAQSRVAPEAGTMLPASFWAPAETGAVRDDAVERPGNFDSHVRSGDSLLARGQGEAALERYRQAARIRLSEKLMLRMVAAYRLAGKEDEAERLVDSYAVAHPASAMVTRLRSERAIRAGDWRRARMLLEKLAAEGGMREVGTLSNLALARLRTGAPTGAESSARQAYRLQPGSPLATRIWARTLAATGGDQATADALALKARRQAGQSPSLPN